MRLPVIAIVFGVLAYAPAARANSCIADKAVDISSGYFSGHHLREMSDLELGSYSMGYIDALAGGNIFGMNPNCLSAIEECTHGRSGHQLAAIVRKFLKENPEQWHVPAHAIMFSAILRQCLLSKAK